MWLLRKLDSLIGTLIAASFGLLGSQLLEFIQQYRQRLGGHLAEAQLALRSTLDNAAFRSLDAGAQQAFVAPQSERVAHLVQASQALAEATGTWDLPVRFFWRIDLPIAAATWKSFQPALPLTAASLVYAVVGMVLGWLAWEVAKAIFAPVRALGRVDAGLARRR